MRWFRPFSLGLCSLSVLAADAPDSYDLDVLPRFPHAEIVDFLQSSSKERVYPLSALNRASGRLLMEDKVRAKGELTALTYRLPHEHSSQEAFAAARASLLKANATLLFWCERRDCGSSNLLANTVFGNSKLYGPDEQQAYLLVRLAAPRENNLVAVYSITRGNRRAYLQAEELKADMPLGELLPRPVALLQLLKANGELTLSHVPVKPAGTWLNLLVKTLQLDSGVRIELSGKHAQEWRDALYEQGVQDGRIELGQPDIEGLHLSWLR